MQMPDFAGLVPTLILLVLCALLYFLRGRQPKPAPFIFPSTKLLPAQKLTFRLKLYKNLWIIRLLALALLLIALSNPRIGREQTSASQSGIAINFLTDRSGSMQEAMVYRNKRFTRLDTVKLVANDFLTARLNRTASGSSDIIALSAFAGFYDELSPFTTDYQGMIQFINSMRIAEKYEDGTMIGDALYQAALRFSILDESQKEKEKDRTYSNIKSRIIILLTDGQQSPNGVYDPVEAARFASSKGVKVYTVAISGQQGMMLGFAQSFFKNDSDDMLQKVAEITGGRFARVESGEDLIQVYEKIDELEKSEIPTTITVYEEKYELPLILGSILLLLYAMARFFVAERLI